MLYKLKHLYRIIRIYSEKPDFSSRSLEKNLLPQTSCSKMKQDFAQVLIPKGVSPTMAESNESLVYTKKGGISRGGGINTHIIALAITLLLFLVGVTVLSIMVVGKMETRMAQGEGRIFQLEREVEDLHKFIKGLSDEELLEYEMSPGLDFGEEMEEYEEEEEGDEEEEILVEELEQEIMERRKTTTPVEFKGESEEEEGEEVLVKVGEGDFGKLKLEDEPHPRGRRNRRQVPYPNLPTFGPDVERTEDGVPIVTESYKHKQATPTEGLRLYERLVENSDTRSGNHNNPGILPHHQVSASWGQEQQGQSSRRAQLRSGDYYGSNEDNVYQRRRPQRQQPTTSNSVMVNGGGSGATYHRSSRVPTTADYFYGGVSSPTTARSYGGHSRAHYPQAPLRKMTVGDGEGEVIARVLQTDLDEAEDNPAQIAGTNIGQSGAQASSDQYRRGGQRHRPRQTQQEGGITSHAQTQSFQSGRKYNRKNQQDSGEISIVKADAWVEAPKPLAAHYVADVSNYTTAHRHYDGNGRLRNADGIFEAWRPAEWMSAVGAGDGTKSFVLSANGVVTVKKSGLYYIYAQVHYLDDHDINGFVLQVNTEPFLQCTVMTETYQAGSKSNSCFTAGIHYLKEEDRIMIRDIETNRYSIFKPEKSFFGLMKVGAVP